MSESIYLIYKHTSPSGKSYIGQTKNYDIRCKRHQTTSACRAFNAAIKKYGWDNFIHEILIEGITLEEANTLESHYIKEHNTFYPSGYNLRTGGLNSIPSDETRSKISASKQGVPRSADTRAKIIAAKQNISEETRAKMSSAKRGKTRSEATRAKISAVQKGRGKGRTLSAETITKRTESRRIKRAARND